MKQILPPTYLFVGLILIGGLWLFFPGPRIVAQPWNLTGLAFIILGVALNIVPIFLFVILNYRFVAFEEQAMAARFGDDYLRYCTRVRRWL